MRGLGAKTEEKTQKKSELKKLELSNCHHSICLQKTSISKKGQNRMKNDRVMASSCEQIHLGSERNLISSAGLLEVHPSSSSSSLAT